MTQTSWYCLYQILPPGTGCVRRTEPSGGQLLPISDQDRAMDDKTGTNWYYHRDLPPLFLSWDPKARTTWGSIPHICLYRQQTQHQDGVWSFISKHQHEWLQDMWLERVLWLIYGSSATWCATDFGKVSWLATICGIRSRRRQIHKTISNWILYLAQQSSDHMVFKEATYGGDLSFWCRFCGNEKRHGRIARFALQYLDDGHKFVRYLFCIRWQHVRHKHRSASRIRP